MTSVSTSTVLFTLHLNYGRSITSADARGMVQRPDLPGVATTDFFISTRPPLDAAQWRIDVAQSFQPPQVIQNDVRVSERWFLPRSSIS